MIQFRFKLTWPLAVLIFVAVAAWLLRHASQAQAHPATAKELHAALNVESMKDVESTVDEVMAVVAKLTEQHALDLA